MSLIVTSGLLGPTKDPLDEDVEENELYFLHSRREFRALFPANEGLWF